MGQKAPVAAAFIEAEGGAVTRHIPIQERKELAYLDWFKQLKKYAMNEAEYTVDPTAPFWRECFNGGMSPEQAFRESFVEDDGI